MTYLKIDKVEISKITQIKVKIESEKLTKEAYSLFSEQIKYYDLDVDSCKRRLKVQLDKAYNEWMKLVVQAHKDQIFKYLTDLFHEIEKDIWKGNVYDNFSDFFKEYINKWETFEKEFPLVDAATKTQLWRNKSKWLVSINFIDWKLLQISWWQLIDQKDRIKFKALSEIHKSPQFNQSDTKKYYEDIIKTKNDKIKELQAENEMLK